MKFTTASTLAIAATSVSASSSSEWNNWAPTTSATVKPTSAETCPATLTVLKTTTETLYASTVEVYKKTKTVPIPEKPASVDVKPVWADWDAKKSTATPCYTLPAGCDAKTTVTETSTSYATKSGVTTVTKSILYVGAADAPAPTGYGKGNDNDNKGDNKGGNKGGDNKGDDWLGGVVSDVFSMVDDVKTIGKNYDVFSWVHEIASEVKTGYAPEYTERPDGTWGGAPWGGNNEWGDWPDNGDGDDGDDGDNDGHGGDGHHGHDGGHGGHGGHGNNGTVPHPPHNGTHTPGDKQSNVTKPFEPLKDGKCNQAGSRSQWCDGKSVKSDYYQDYFSGNDCTYDLTITNGTSNPDGKEILTYLINGQSPGPLIECNWGDRVKITVHNKLEHNGTTIHWHGIRQVGTNDQDGVPGMTECAIAPGESRSYEFLASSYGTSWYHSHAGRQYGDGIRGPMVIHGPATAEYDVDAGPVFLSDTFNRTVEQQAYILAHVGPQGTVNYLMNGHNVAYDLSAGQHPLWTVKKGKKYLFRLINGAVQNMFTVSIDSHKMKVIAADFVPVKPYETEEVHIGIGQRYDVIVEMDQDVDSYFFRAVTQTSCPSSCQNSGLGQANGIIAYEGVSDSPYYLPTSTVNGNKKPADYNTCLDEPLSSLVPYVSKTAGTKSSFKAQSSTLPAGNVTRVQTTDDGSVFRWFLNNAALYINYTSPTLQRIADDEVKGCPNHITLEKKDEWYYFVIQNQFFPAHPMHLHGHDFSVLGQGSGIFTNSMVDTLNFDNPIRRDTAMLQGTAPPKGAPPSGNPPPSGYTVIGFQTDNPGAWLMHCHILWHVDGGLGMQWIEVPDEINKYGWAKKGDFQDECSAFDSWESANPQFKMTSGTSGLRKRNTGLFFDEEVAAIGRGFGHVVRRHEHSPHRYLDTHLKRGLGDGVHRHFGRR